MPLKKTVRFPVEFYILQRGVDCYQKANRVFSDCAVGCEEISLVILGKSLA